MRRSRRQPSRWWIAVALLPPIAAVTTCAALRPSLDRNTSGHTLQSGGKERSYYLHVPPRVRRDQQTPLVVVLHGGGGKGRNMERFTGFTALADREGFLVAYPDGLGHNWNDGRETTSSEAHRDHVDDVGFIGAMVEEIARSFAIDRKRIFATGISNGGFLSNYLAANRADLFAAIAPVVGGLADPFHKRFAPSAPVAVLILQGTADPLVPYHGGEVAWGRGRFIDTDETVRRWVGANGCVQPPVVEALQDYDKEDECQGVRSTYGGCRDNAEVVLVRLEGGGHTWPGGTQYLPKRIIGPVCRDFEATQMIWDFFARHPKK